MNLVNFKMRNVHFSRVLRKGCLAGLLLLSANFTFAQDVAPAALASADTITPEGLTARYPSGSIQSGDMANRALAEVAQQRATLEQKYAAQQHVCYSKFLASSCLDAAKESRRLALAQIRKVEIEANSFIRSARVVERDQRLAEKRANEASNRAKPVTELPAAAEPPSKQSGQPEIVRTRDGEPRLAKHEARLRQAQLAEKNNAKKRAEDVAAFEKKAKDAAARQRDIAAKKADKERQAAAKAASTATAAKP